MTSDELPKRPMHIDTDQQVVQLEGIPNERESANEVTQTLIGSSKLMEVP